MDTLRGTGPRSPGVDMIVCGERPCVLEVNASLGFRGLLEASRINAADAKVDYAAEGRAAEAKAPCAVAAWGGLVDEAPIPGSRVRATTRHGSLTVDELAEMQPGMSRLMDELARRFWALYYAAKGGNWALAAYMERESEKLLRTMAVARPKYREDLETFSRERLGPLAKTIEAKDFGTFDAAYEAAVRASDSYHAKYHKGFIGFRLPARPPEWFDLGPR